MLCFWLEDGGAGVGRVSDYLLLHLFSRVDLVEPSKQLIDTARERLGDTDGRHPNGNRADQYFCMGLQDFHPEPNKYSANTHEIHYPIVCKAPQGFSPEYKEIPHSPYFFLDN